VSLGGLTSLFFMTSINEVKLSSDAKEIDTDYKRTTMGQEALLEEENSK